MDVSNFQFFSIHEFVLTCFLSWQIPGGNRGGGRKRKRIRENVDEEEISAVWSGEPRDSGEEAIAASKAQRKKTKHDRWYRSERNSTGYRRVSYVSVRDFNDHYRNYYQT